MYRTNSEGLSCDTKVSMHHVTITISDSALASAEWHRLSDRALEERATDMARRAIADFGTDHQVDPNDRFVLRIYSLGHQQLERIHAM